MSGDSGARYGLKIELVSLTTPGAVDVLSATEFGALYLRTTREDDAITTAPFWVTLEGGEVTLVARRNMP